MAPFEVAPSQAAFAFRTLQVVKFPTRVRLRVNCSAPIAHVVPRPHDVVEAKHDVIEAKHDVIKAKHDVIEAKHDVIKAKHDVICLLQFAKSFFPCLLGGALGGGRRRRRPGYEHGGPLMRPESGRDAP